MLVPILAVAAGCGAAAGPTTTADCDDPVLVYPGGSRLSGYTVIESTPDVEPTILTDALPVFEPVVSPDGTLIAVGHGGGTLEECCGYERSRIAVLDRADELRDLSADGAGPVWDLQWSADGREIFYTRAGVTGNDELFAVDLEGRERTLLRFNGWTGQVAVEPDGTHALVVTENGLRRYDLADGTHEVLDIGLVAFHRVSPGPAGGIAVIARERIGAGSGIYVYDPTTAMSTPVFVQDGLEGGVPHALAWSGDDLVFNAAMGTPTLGFFIWDRATGDVRELDRPGLNESASSTGGPLSTTACDTAPPGEQPD